MINIFFILLLALIVSICIVLYKTSERHKYDDVYINPKNEETVRILITGELIINSNKERRRIVNLYDFTQDKVYFMYYSEFKKTFIPYKKYKEEDNE